MHEITGIFSFLFHHGSHSDAIRGLGSQFLIDGRCSIVSVQRCIVNLPGRFGRYHVHAYSLERPRTREICPLFKFADVPGVVDSRRTPGYCGDRREILAKWPGNVQHRVQAPRNDGDVLFACERLLIDKREARCNARTRSDLIWPLPGRWTRPWPQPTAPAPGAHGPSRPWAQVCPEGCAWHKASDSFADIARSSPWPELLEFCQLQFSR